MESLSFVQKSLYAALLALVALMIIFSFMSLKNRGMEGYNQCIQAKCELAGEEYCTKFREVNNCCLGAAGKVVLVENAYSCTFN